MEVNVSTETDDIFLYFRSFVETSQTKWYVLPSAEKNY